MFGARRGGRPGMQRGVRSWWGDAIRRLFGRTSVAAAIRSSRAHPHASVPRRSAPPSALPAAGVAHVEDRVVELTRSEAVAIELQAPQAGAQSDDGSDSGVAQGLLSGFRLDLETEDSARTSVFVCTHILSKRSRTTSYHILCYCIVRYNVEHSNTA